MRVLTERHTFKNCLHNAFRVKINTTQTILSWCSETKCIYTIQQTFLVRSNILLITLIQKTCNCFKTHYVHVLQTDNFCRINDLK